ncbi:hypothetical protein [Cryptosporidium parvum Iowa II]|uniref:RNA-editing substrate-binding complex 6 protein domain-containing protein n=2 Tax=Cryptosporidium parvum TaxID=5807 RepID=Q5CUT8_CRYPI|nr:hypothetical protein [Cryptosporidium parvum Iowa II]EAK89138.1 hypothetical protein with transmembrane or GPI anchor sequence at carboxy terminus [Cryptosporidium parvum Iowa II]QOY42501.1 Uncharacterized protein CPATCC_0032480 [Cryptosporidium parvum]WKS76894.1 transmembrane domain-containing or GPI anchor-containing protein [Cryptosporidium sp. 43IA8]WRK31386.1 Uncharacterized protein cpbgf_3001520 [Cryptosporidium parvum]|eukprot:QOY42501.1 hypothetical protein CPATCC_001145 [Cryptosporidium parvum]
MQACNNADLHHNNDEISITNPINIIPNSGFQQYFDFSRTHQCYIGQFSGPYEQRNITYNNGVLYSRDEHIVFNLKMNKIITASESFGELLGIVHCHIYYLNEINMVSILHKLAVLSQSNNFKGRIKRDERFRLLLDVIVLRSNFPCRFSPKELSNIAWSLVKLGLNNHKIFDFVCNESIIQLERFISINLSIILWSFAKAGKFNKNLFVYAIPKILSELDNLEPQQISNIAWSYSKVGLVSPHLFENLKRKSIQTIDKFLPIHISMLCYAFSLADIVPTDLYELISKMEICSFTPKAMAHIFWSFSLAELKSPINWLFWILDSDRISLLTMHELNLLISSFSLNFIKGFVLIKHSNSNDYNIINNNDLQKISISKALAIKDRDPESCVIEWNSSYHLLNIVQVRQENNFNDYDYFIWDTLDKLSTRLYEKFKGIKEISDVVWMLTFIGKDTSKFIQKANKKLPNDLNQIFNYQNSQKSLGESCCNSIENISLVSNTCDLSPFSTCCNSESPDGSSTITSEKAHKDLDQVLTCTSKKHCSSEVQVSLISYSPTSINSDSNHLDSKNTNSIPSILALFAYNIFLVFIVLVF